MGTTTEGGHGGSGQITLPNWLRSNYNFSILTNAEGQHVATCNGRLLYSGPSWEQAKTAVMTYFGVTIVNGQATINPGTFNKDTIGEMLDTHGLEQVERAA